MNQLLPNQFASDWRHLMWVMMLLLNLLILVTVSSGETSLGDENVDDLLEELSPEDAKDRLGLLAKKMDKDDDGFMNKKELGNWLSYNIDMQRQKNMLREVESNFKWQDADHDGFLEWKEYEAHLSKGHNESDPILKNYLIEDRLVFDAADDDKDERLDSIEYQSFGFPHGNLDKMVMVILELVNKIQDINKDGKIDYDEYVKNRGKDRDEEWLKEDKKFFHSTLDKNGDGTLDKQELIDWVKGDDSVADQTNELISAADDNQDGKLSMEEIVGHHEVFVNSEITNFGDDLHKIERLKDEL